MKKYYFYLKYDSLLIKRGNKINKGDIIAEMGSTGKSTGPIFAVKKWKVC